MSKNRHHSLKVSEEQGNSQDILNRLRVLLQIVETNSESMKETVKYDIFNFSNTARMSKSPTPMKKAPRKNRRAAKVMKKRFNQRIDPLVQIETKVPFSPNISPIRRRASSVQRKRNNSNHKSCYSRMSFSEIL